MRRQSADDDHALIRFDRQAAARIDHHGIRRRRQGQRQRLLGAHAPSQNKFGAASSAAKPSPFQGDAKTGHVLVRTSGGRGLPKGE
jgi:hypothetical protein